MSWVKAALAGLRTGGPVTVRPQGGSMRGRIASGQSVTLIPATLADVAVDDIVFVRWKGNYLLHLVKAREPDRILIGNNVGKINGWVAAQDILGKVIAVGEEVTMMLRAVIFDVGGVLSRTTDFTLHSAWAARVDMTVPALANLVFENEVARRATIGQATPDEVWAHLAGELVLTSAEVEQLRADWWATAEWDMALLDLVAGLRPRYKTGVLSDAWSDARTAMVPYVTADRFDVIMFSAEEGLQKPAPELYRRAVDRLGVAPEEAIFIDDRLHNIEGAIRVGLQGLLFTTSEAVQAELARRLGL